jgi:hypothetical protein
MDYFSKKKQQKKVAPISPEKRSFFWTVKIWTDGEYIEVNFNALSDIKLSLRGRLKSQPLLEILPENL